MSRRPPDPITLDAMVQGDTVEPQAWDALVASPDGTDAFRQAMQRRAKINRLALLTLQHPRMASAMHRVRRSLSLMAQQVQAVIEPTPLLSTLSGGAASRTVNLNWGTVEVAAVPIGAAVHLLIPSPGGRAFALTSDSVVDVPSLAWTLEAGEAPLLFVVVAEAINGQDLPAVMAQGGAMAGLLVDAIEETST